MGDCRDVLRDLPERPYFGLRDYGHAGQIGLEPTPDEFVAALVEVFREVRRALRDDGTVWLNLGDSYSTSPKGNPGALSSGLTNGGRNTAQANAHRGGVDTSKLPGIKPKDLIGIPWLVAFALRADGWYLRSDIVWHKPNPMPESVTDRPTRSHEYVFLLSKSARYFYDADAIREDGKDWSSGSPGVGIADTTERYGAGNGGNGGLSAIAARYKAGEQPPTRNKRDVWTVTTKPFRGAHFATFPPDLIEPCVLAGCPEGGTVLDPFSGAGTTGLVALHNGRSYVGLELNPEYAEMSRDRIQRYLDLGFREARSPSAPEDQEALF